MALRWTLYDELNWFTTQANNPENPYDERQMWLSLADELAQRLGVNFTPDDIPLF